MTDENEAILKVDASPAGIETHGDEEENLAVRTAAVVANFQASTQGGAAGDGSATTPAEDVVIDAGGVDLGDESLNLNHLSTIGSPGYVICNEKDVLMGRGKRISEWAGNQRFRTIVSKYRPAYLSSLRSAKIHVAKQVIVEVLANGGRFLRETDPGNTGIVAWSKWLPVEMDRCIEKTCQALREKEKTGKRTSEAPPEGAPSAGDGKKVRTSGDYELLQRFRAFVEKQGHSAVPPGWDEDIELSDWVTVQRRLFRDLEEGILVERKRSGSAATLSAAALDESETIYNDGEKMSSPELVLETNETLLGIQVTDVQQRIIDELRKVDFVTDYADWHWENSFKLFVEGDLTTKRVWLRQQRRNHREGTLTPARRTRLEAAGVNFMVNQEK
jgi:Helicase associated domain